MINSLKKRKTPKKTNTHRSYKNNIKDINIPEIYIKINQEILRSKMMDYFSIKSNLLLCKKFFDRIKFFYKLRKFRKKIKLAKKRKSFDFLIKFLMTSKKITNKYIRSFVQFRKLILFFNFIKSTKISLLKKIFLIKFLKNNLQSFILCTKNRIEEKQSLQMRKIIFFFIVCLKKLKEFHLRTLAHKDKKSSIKTSLKLFRINNYLKETFIKVKNSYIACSKTFQKKFYHLIKKYFIKLLFKNLNNNLTQNKNFTKLKEIFRYRIYFQNFKTRIKFLSQYAKRYKLAKKFYNEKLLLKGINSIRQKMISFRKFIEIVKKKFFTDKEKLKFFVFYYFKKKIENLKFLYKNLKKQKLIRLKRKFLSKIQTRLDNHKKKEIVTYYNIDTNRRKIFSLLHKNFSKSKFFSNFLKSFQKIYKDTLKSTHLSLLKFKCKKLKIDYLEQNTARPHIIKYFDTIINKKKNISLNMKKMKNFFKKCKKKIKAKINLRNKLKISEFFYNKKLLLKFNYGMHVLRNFLIIKKKKENFYKKKFFDLVENYKRGKISFTKIEERVKKGIAVKYLPKYVKYKL